MQDYYNDDKMFIETENQYEDIYCSGFCGHDAPRMGGMMLTMPFISLIIGFSVSCAAGFYWACSSLISGAIQSIIQIYYGPNKIIAAEQSKELVKRNKEEKAIKAKKG